MAQCEWAMLVGLQLCWPSFVYDYSEDENSLSLHQLLSVNSLTCNQFLQLQIQYSLLQWLSVNGARSWWDYNYVGLHLFMTIQMMKIHFYSTNGKVLLGLQLSWPSFVYDYSEEENSLSLCQWLGVNRPYLQSE